MANEFEKFKKKLIDQYGADSIMSIGDMPSRGVISSGSLALDFATTLGGLPTDRVVEICGAEGIGKTTLALLAMKNFLIHQPDRYALILDLEHKINGPWVETLLGRDLMDRILLAWPDHVEAAEDMFTVAVGSGQVCFVLFDSIGGAPAKQTTEKSATIGSFGGNSRAITAFARTAGTYSNKYNCLTLGINQTREDMQGYHRLITPGGTAWKYQCTLRIWLKRTTKGVITEKVSGEDIPVGREIKAQIVKNGNGQEGRTATWWFFNTHTEKYGFGVDTLQEIVNLSMLTGVIEQKGAWYYHPALPSGQANGRDKVVEAIRDADQSVKDGLSKQIMDALNSGNYASAVAPIEPLPVTDEELKSMNYFERKLGHEE